MRIIIFAFIVALLAVNFPVAASLIATNAESNKKSALKNSYGYFIGISTIVTTTITKVDLSIIVLAYQVETVSGMSTEVD